MAILIIFRDQKVVNGKSMSKFVRCSMFEAFFVVKNTEGA